MTDSASHPEKEQNAEQPFPAESEWLDLPCPEVSADFVEDTWQRARAGWYDRGSDDEPDDADAPDPDAIELPREVLDAYTVPQPSPGFLEATWAATRASAWQRALAQHSVPEPSPNFVERVLRSLHEPTQRRGVVRQLASRRVLWLASAAAVLIAALWLNTWSDDSILPFILPFEVLSSQAFSPDPWAVALSSLSDHGLAVVPDDPTLRLGELAGLGGGR